MYCKRGLRCFLLNTKRSCTSVDIRNLLKVSPHGIESRSGLTTSSFNVVYGTGFNRNSKYQKLQDGITWSCHSQSRNIQMTELHFPKRCQNTGGGCAVTGSLDNQCEMPVTYSELRERLLKCSSVQEQIEELCNIMRLSPEDIKRREHLCLQVKEMLSPFFDKFRVQMYGSSTNGFGFKGCDIDMSLSIIGDNRKPIQSYFEDPDLPSVSDVLNGKVSIEYIANLPQKEQLLFIHSVFIEYYRETVDPILFVNAYVPIIRFNHDRYELKCDFSFGNNFASRNSKLLKLCGLIDERVTQMMMFVRYWAKHVGLCGKGLVFNTYTISLFVLYFLQTRRPPVLPSVEYLLSVSEYIKNDDMEDDLYLQDMKKIPPSENKQTTVELLKEFFFYFAYFDYTQVMRPLTGRTFPRTEMHLLHKNFRMNTICIQDPIKLNHNVATLVEYKMCRNFFKELLTNVKLFHAENIMSPSHSDWGILLLLEKPENYSTALSDQLLSFVISKIPAASQKEQRETNCQKDTESKQLWFQKVSRVLLNVLEHGLLFECKVIEDVEHSRHSQSSVPQEDSLAVIINDCHRITSDASSFGSAHSKDFPHHQEEPSFTISCIAYHNTWLGREDLKLEGNSIDSALDSLETEHAISMKLIDRRKKEDKRENVLSYGFMCECYEMDCGKEASLLIKLKPCKRTYFNPILGLFLKEYIPKTVIEVLKHADMHMSRQQNVLNSI